MRYLITAALLALVSLPSFAGYTNVVRSVRPLQVVNDGEFRNICTTTSINSTKYYWLTAAHCVSGNDGLYVAGHPALVEFVDTKADVAVLHTVGYTAPALRMRTTRPSVEQAIKVVGYPLGLPSVQVFNGRISSLRTFVDDADYMLYDMTACGGNSGSVVVDSNDQVVSVLQIGFGKGCSAFSGGMPWEDMARLVYKYFGR